MIPHIITPYSSLKMAFRSSRNLVMNIMLKQMFYLLAFFLQSGGTPTESGGILFFY